MKLAELLDGLDTDAIQHLAATVLRGAPQDRLPPSLVRGEVEAVLKSYSYVQEALAPRQPPAFAIAITVIEAEAHAISVGELRQIVADETTGLCSRVAEGEVLTRGKDYDLYRSVLAEAWRSGLTVDTSEAALLEILRRKLGISHQEHLFVLHHPEITPFWQGDHAFERERNALLASGLLFVHRDRYVVAEDLVPLMRQAWGIPLSRSRARRLYAELTVTELATALNELSLKQSGSKEERGETLISNSVSPLEVLQTLNLVESLRPLAKRVGCSTAGTKEELIDNVIVHFDRDGDLVAARAEAEAREEAPPPAPEPKTLNEAAFRDLFSQLTGEELYEILSSLSGLRLSGSKDARITTLWEGRFAELSLLRCLTNRSLGMILDRRRLPVSGPKEEKIERLIEYGRSARSNELLQRDVPPALVGVESVPPASMAPVTPAPPPAVLAKTMERFSFLDKEQAVIVSILTEMQSLSDLELEQAATRHGLNWYFLREEMRRLIATMNKNGAPLIEKREAGEHDVYVFREAR